MLNDHVQGNQHRSKLESSLEASLLKAKDTGPSSLTGHVEWSDSHRDVKVVKTEAKNGSLAALQEVHYAQPIELSKRTYVNTEVKETMPPSEAQLQTSMKESLLELEKHTARKTGHVKWNDSHKDVQFVKSEAKNGSSALQKLRKRTYAYAEEGNGMPHASKKSRNLKLAFSRQQNGHVEGSDSHRDIQVVKSGAKNGSSAALQEYMQPIEVPKSTYANTEVKETKPPPKASRAGTLPLKKEWNVKSEAKNGSSALQEMQYAQPIKGDDTPHASMKSRNLKLAFQQASVSECS
ncbi:hypothetical protein AAHA92_30579 [Salvia divinorum]|uniref:Uncharacterized protein n=1 Tax=Salvia divinorum TaxID=28513 RepID=A0ABD1FRE0_SALDI